MCSHPWQAITPPDTAFAPSVPPSAMPTASAVAAAAITAKLTALDAQQQVLVSVLFMK